MTKLERYDLDFYETDPRLTLTLLLKTNIHGDIFEPCVGDWAIADLFPRCLTADINPLARAHLYQDARLPESWAPLHHQFDWVVTNPPFSMAAEILPQAMKAARVGVAALLRLSWLEPAKNRKVFLKDRNTMLSDLIIFNPRPQFRTDTRSTDSVTVAWMVWRKDWFGEGTNIQFADRWKDIDPERNSHVEHIRHGTKSYGIWDKPVKPSGYVELPPRIKQARLDI